MPLAEIRKFLRVSKMGIRKYDEVAEYFLMTLSDLAKNNYTHSNFNLIQLQIYVTIETMSKLPFRTLISLLTRSLVQTFK